MPLMSECDAMRQGAMPPVLPSGMQATPVAGEGATAEETNKARADGNCAAPDGIGAELARRPPVGRRHIGHGENGREKDGQVPVQQEKRVKDGEDAAAASEELEDGVPAQPGKVVPHLSSGQHQRQQDQKGEHLAAPTVIGIRRLSHDHSPLAAVGVRSPAAGVNNLPYSVHTDLVDEPPMFGTSRPNARKEDVAHV